MFHFMLKPSPPMSTGRETMSQAVDSSATVIAPGKRAWITWFISCRKEMASRFSRPPCTFGSHSPSLRE